MRQGFGVIIAAVVLFLCASLAQAQAQEVNIPLRGHERFVLKAYDAQIVWTVVASPTLKIKGLSESQGVRRGDLLVFDLKELSSKEDFASLMKKKGVPLKIEITGPSMPVDLNLRDGAVKFSKISHEVKIQMIQGDVNLMQSQAPVFVRVHKGHVSISEASAKSILNVYSGSVSLKGVVDSDVDLFSGNLNVQNLKGPLVLTTQSAVSKISEMSGTLTLDSQKGATSLTKFQGRIEGHTQEGSVSAELMPETEVQLKSQSGRLSFQVPKNSGAGLNLWTADGEIVVPNELKVARLATEKIVRGKLRGESQKITISARTTEGVVAVK